jgi:transposase
MGRLPEAWIAPPAVRSQRELVRHRHKLRQLCSGIKSGAHAVLAKNRLCIPRSDVFGLDGRRRLAELALPEAFRICLDSQLRVVDLPEAEIDTMDARIAALFTEHDQAYRAVLRVPGIGPVFAAVFRAEIGEVTGFPSPRQINSMGRADPSPPRVRHHCPSRTDHETGLAAVRWAAVEAVQRSRAGTDAPHLRTSPHPARCRAKHLAKVAAARELLSCVFYALRDGHVRRLASTAT